MIVPPELSSGGVFMDKITFSWLIYTNFLCRTKNTGRRAFFPVIKLATRRYEKPWMIINAYTKEEFWDSLPICWSLDSPRRSHLMWSQIRCSPTTGSSVLPVAARIAISAAIATGYWRMYWSILRVSLSDRYKRKTHPIPAGIGCVTLSLRLLY